MSGAVQSPAGLRRVSWRRLLAEPEPPTATDGSGAGAAAVATGAPTAKERAVMADLIMRAEGTWNKQEEEEARKAEAAGRG